MFDMKILRHKFTQNELEIAAYLAISIVFVNGLVMGAAGVLLWQMLH